MSGLCTSIQGNLVKYIYVLACQFGGHSRDQFLMFFSNTCFSRYTRGFNKTANSWVPWLKVSLRLCNMLRPWPTLCSAATLYTVESPIYISLGPGNLCNMIEYVYTYVSGNWSRNWLHHLAGLDKRFSQEASRVFVTSVEICVRIREGDHGIAETVYMYQTSLLLSGWPGRASRRTFLLLNDPDPWSSLVTGPEQIHVPIGVR